MTADAPRLRAHVYGLAAALGVLVAEVPDLVFWDASIEDGRITCAPITGTVSYFAALHELGHAMAGKPPLSGDSRVLWSRKLNCYERFPRINLPSQQRAVLRSCWRGVDAPSNAQ